MQRNLYNFYKFFLEFSVPKILIKGALISRFFQDFPFSNLLLYLQCN